MTNLIRVLREEEWGAMFRFLGQWTDGWQSVLLRPESNVSGKLGGKNVVGRANISKGLIHAKLHLLLLW